MQNISDFIFVEDSGHANITINPSLYEIDAILAASYSFTDSYHILVTRNDADLLTVIFESKGEGTPVDIAKDIKDFMNTTIDHQLRLQLDRTNGKIRDLIVAHAFSPIDLQKELEP